MAAQPEASGRPEAGAGSRAGARPDGSRAAGTEERLSHERALQLHGRRPEPHALPPVGRTFRNDLGVWDLHGLVWEWTDDFNAEMLSGAGRDDRGLDRELFCAAGSAGVSDPSDYAAFLRASFRASLDGTRGGLTLGFRCAYDAS